MKPADPLNVDFAALRTLCLVHTHRSFSAAANILDLNQSTISYTIDRLRNAFDDPLFVRQGAGIATTPRCDALVTAAEQILGQYGEMVEPAEFDPARSVATVCISSNYYERVTSLPTFARTLRSQAPGVHLRMIQSLTEGAQHLKSGESDLLLSPMPIHGPGFYTRRLFSDRYVCIMDRANPLSGQVLNARSYCAAKHALVSYGGNWRSFYMVEMEAAGYELTPSLSIPSPEAIADFLIGTDLISTIPARIAHLMPENIAVTACPFPGDFDVSMYWTARTHQSRLQQWIRGLIVQTLAVSGREDSDIDKFD